MKKSLLFILSLIICLSLFGCEKGMEKRRDYDEKDLDTSESSETSQEIADKYPEATKLIEEGKFAEAYELLYAERDDEEAKERLASFKWVPKKQNESHSFGDSSETSFELDENGNVLLEHTIYSSSSSEFHTYSYDKKGRVVRESLSGTMENDFVETVEYDEYDNVIKRITDGDGYTSVETAVVKDGKIVRKEIIINSYEYIYEYNYDEKGNLDSVDKTENGAKERLFTYFYDEKGNNTKCIQHDLNILTVCTYNEQGLLLRSEDTYDDLDDNAFKEYTYDDEGRTLTFTQKGLYGSPITTEYIYDELGRLTSEQSRSDNAPEYYQDTVYFDFECFYLGE